MARTKPRKPFRLPERTATVHFEEGHPYHGLELDLRLTAPMGLFWQFARIEEISEAGDARDLYLQFAEAVLIGWNLEDKGGLVPATPEAFADRLDQATQLQIMTRWTQAVAELPVPLALPSPSTDTSAAS